MTPDERPLSPEAVFAACRVIAERIAPDDYDAERARTRAAIAHAFGVPLWVVDPTAPRPPIRARHRRAPRWLKRILGLHSPRR